MIPIWQFCVILTQFHGVAGGRKWSAALASSRSCSPPDGNGASERADGRHVRRIGASSRVAAPA